MEPRCTGCKLHESAQTVRMDGRGNPESGLFVICDRPNYTEDNNGLSFTSTASKLLVDLLKRAGLTLDDYFLTYSIRCCDTTNSEDKEPSKVCPPMWLYKEIDEYKPKVVVAVGGDVMTLLLPHLHGIKKNRGVFFDGGTLTVPYKVIPTFSPAYLLNEHRDAETQVIMDLKRASSALKNGIDSWSNKKLSGLTYRTIETVEDFLTMKKEIEDAGIVACDIECRKKDAYHPPQTPIGFPLVSIQFSTKEETGWFLPIAHEKFQTEYNALGMAWTGKSWDTILRGLRDILESKEIFLIGHNFKFDSKWILKWLDIRPALNFDTMLAHGLFGETSNVLKKIAWEKTDLGGYEEEQARYTESLETDKRYDMFFYPYEQLATYGCADADVTFRIFLDLDKQFEENPQLFDLFTTLIKASRVFVDLENEGIKVDSKYLKQLGVELELEIKNYEAEFLQKAYLPIKEIEDELLVAATGKSGKVLKNKPIKFNIASNDHVGRLFYDKLNYPILDRYRSKKTKEPSLGRKVLEALAPKKPLAATLLKYRTVSKQKVGFVDAYPAFIDENDRIHPDFKLIKFFNEAEDKEQGTATGRLACSDPNLQQVPSRDKTKRIKKLFIPDYPSHFLVDCLAPGTRILTSDFQWKKIEDLVVGEDLVGFDEKLNKNTCLRRSKIEHISSRTSKRYRVTTDKGSIICSDNHTFPCFRQYEKGGYSKRGWKTPQQIAKEPGLKISFLCDPWSTTETYADGWMSGMLEGEGWVTKRGGCGIAQNPGDLLERVKSKLVA